MELIFRLAVRFRIPLLIGMAVLTLMMGFFIPQVKIISSQQHLISSEHPAQKRYLEFISEFGAIDNLVVVLEGDYETLLNSAEKFAAEIDKEDRWVKSMFYKTETSLFLERASLYIPVEDLENLSDIVDEQGNFVSRINSTNNLAEIIDQLNRVLSGGGYSIDPSKADELLLGLRLFFEEWKLWLTREDYNQIHVLKKLGLGEAQFAIASKGYFFSNDCRMLFLFVQPTSSKDDISYLKPFIGNIRGACERVLEKNPELKGKIKYAFTGLPAHVLTETEIVYSDISKAGSISIVVVAIILIFGFRSFRKMIIAVVPLVSGLVIALGLITATIGSLNLISSMFLAALFGIGIDFGIYLIRRTEEELGNGKSREEAVHDAVVKSGRGIMTGGYTTGLAFLVLILSDFTGYSELGYTAGIGVLVVLATTFLILPALLLTFSVQPRKYDVSKSIEHSRDPARKKTIRLIFIAAFLFTAFGVAAIFLNDFDYNVLKLLPRNVDSTMYQIKMEEESNFNMSFAVLTGDSLDDMRELEKKAKHLSVVSRVDSLSEMIPKNQKEKIKILSGIRRKVGNVRPSYEPSPANSSVFTNLLDRLIENFQVIQEDAFSGGRSDLVKEIDLIIGTLKEIQELLKNEDSAAVERTLAFEKKFFGQVMKITDYIPAWLNPKPFNETAIPDDVKKRFKSSKGSYVAYVYPNGSIYDVDFLDKFVSELKQIQKNVTGFPVTHQVYIRQAVRGVIFPVIASFFIVFLLLLLDFKNIKAVLLAMTPLIIGLVSLQGVLYAAQVSYNVANIAGFPLLLGLGVVYGVHIVHRWLERPDITAFAAAHTTGRGVAFSALTTVSGIFSLVFAHHGGASSFGKVLLFGIIMSLITALVLLPAIIDAFYLKNNDGDKQ